MECLTKRTFLDTFCSAFPAIQEVMFVSVCMGLIRLKKCAKINISSFFEWDE